MAVWSFRFSHGAARPSSGSRTMPSVMHKRSENGRFATSQLAAFSLLAVSLGRAFGNHLQHEATRLDSPAGSMPPPITFPIVLDFTDLPTKQSKTTTRFLMAFLWAPSTCYGLCYSIDWRGECNGGIKCIGYAWGGQGIQQGDEGTFCEFVAVRQHVR